MKPNKGHGSSHGSERESEQKSGAEETQRQRLEKERQILNPKQGGDVDPEVEESDGSQKDDTGPETSVQP